MYSISRYGTATDDTPGPKRARRACLNCRRKKIRCSGRRPTCDFCSRLKQECRWDDDLVYVDGSVNMPTAIISLQGSTEATQREQHVAFLAARVDMLESQLSMMNAPSLPQFTPSPPLNEFSDFDCLPDEHTVLAAAETYLRHSWNQPYCYFDEATLLGKIKNGDLPDYLLLAILATAARFSEDPFFEGRQAEATERYARLSWNEISEQIFSDDHALSIHAVQASSMLGVIDFIYGRVQMAWVKVGLSIRFAQSLRLSNETDQDISFSEKEERRRTFWSVYLLDRIVSCGRDRPPAILDDDCTISLPMNERNFIGQADIRMPALSTICDLPEVIPLQRDDYFSSTIFMASILGSIVRYHFMQSSKPKYSPWDFRSEFARIHGALLSFETYSEATDMGDFTKALTSNFCDGSGSRIGRHACHFVFSHFLYHLNYCLLNHPLLLRHKLRFSQARIPPNFSGESSQRSLQHATSLSLLLKTLQERNCSSYPSFYGYGATVAGGLHRLRAVNQQSLESSAAITHYNICLEYLGRAPGQWESHQKMSDALRAFCPSESLSASLLFPSSVPQASLPDYEELWQLIDYGWLSSAGASKRTIAAQRGSPDERTETFTPNIMLADWNDFGPRFFE